MAVPYLHVRFIKLISKPFRYRIITRNYTLFIGFRNKILLNGHGLTLIKD